jgi:hypothetical protein
VLVNRFGCDGATLLAKGLENNRTLNTLIVSCKFHSNMLHLANDIGADGAITLAKSISLNKSLTHLNLMCTFI